MHTLIIGSGMAGITLARELRKLDKTRPITVVTADDGNYYAKPSLSNAFACGKEAEQLVLTPAAKLAADLSIELLTHTRVAGIDAAARRVSHANGTLAYQQLVLAVGASPLPLPLAGDGVRDVLAINHLDDYRRLRQQLAGRQRIAIIGAGLIGCEFANDLRLGHFAVDLYDLAARPLARLLPPAAATNLRDKLAGIGVGLHLSSRLAAIQKQGDSYLLLDQQGEARKYDLVIAATGLRPNLALAKSAGLATDLGILTDDCLRTSVPDIYALGDCIEIAGRHLPYVQPLLLGARSLAATLCGDARPVSYPAMPIVVKTPACPTVISPPPVEDGSWQEDSDADGLRALYRRPGEEAPSGFVLQGAHTRERMALSGRMPGLPA